MTKKESIKQVVQHIPMKPVPHCIRFTNAALEKYRLHKGFDFDPVSDGGAYIVSSHTNSGWEQIKPGYWRDYYGVIWNKTHDTTLGVVEETLIKSPSFREFEFPDPGHVPVYQFIPENNRNHPEHFHILSIGFALFERAWSLTGMEQLMVYFMLEPAFVHDLLERITAYNIAVIRRAAEIGGIDGVYLGDDWGGQSGLLMGPEIWREFIMPCYKRICDAVHTAGMLVFLHSCGNVGELMPDIIECGTDIFNPFQPEVMDIWKIKEEFQDELAFWGGLSVQQTLPYGTVSEVLSAGKKLLNEMGKQGGYIFSPSHALTGDIPVENIDALISLANDQ